ncbi:hypothetical protein S7711_05783 [Stachybotrys chartarum IBT 7711]|uniref:Thioesterase domain-containing protein n=1 Tax=Stachybotrys chartarum (strain CBS 109288 / IBT 7711) TaxID=1280523 RepID=A0A084ATH2_STACB|nr:hypothetical protein S7711_05783 [Stachybotrys chartarum IBT 7711]
MESKGNPALLQKGDPSRLPLFLIHDSSGGIFNYYKLETLERPVYTIYNPWFRNKHKWEGGIELFVSKYIELIKTVVPRGDILIGGWSLGGQIGLDIARTLAQNKKSRLHVVGLVMIDTLYPYWGPPENRHAEFPVDLVLGPCPQDMREEILRCTQWSKEDCEDWVARNWKAGSDDLGDIEATQPPPTIRLHAAQYIPVGKNENGAVAILDSFRHARGGWDFFPHEFIETTWDVPAHHFGLFDSHVIKETSDKVRRACDLLADD